jgi:ferredoxin
MKCIDCKACIDIHSWGDFSLRCNCSIEHCALSLDALDDWNCGHLKELYLSGYGWKPSELRRHNAVSYYFKDELTDKEREKIQRDIDYHTGMKWYPGETKCYNCGSKDLQWRRYSWLKPGWSLPRIKLWLDYECPDCHTYTSFMSVLSDKKLKEKIGLSQ